MNLRLSRARVLAGAVAAVGVAPQALRAQTLERIRLAGVTSDDLVPIYYAVRNGLYEKAGLAVEIVPTASGTAATTAVVTGAYEMGKASPIAPMLAYLRGIPIKVMAHNVIWDQRNPFNVITVAADSPIKTGADLNGKTASAPALNDINTLAISAWVDKNGGDSKTVKFVEIPLAAAAAALVEHRIDVCALLEPQLSAAIDGGKVRVLAPGFNAIAERFCIGVYVVNPDWAAKHPDAVKKWVRVTYEAAAYTNAHHAETAPMMSEATKIPLPLFARMARAECGTLASADPALLQPLIDAAARYKQLPRTFNAREIYFTG